jgi:hypothetical protein
LPTLQEPKIAKKSPSPSFTPIVDDNIGLSINSKKRRIKRPKFSLVDSESLDARRKNFSRVNYEMTPSIERGSEIKIINENDF